MFQRVASEYQVNLQSRLSPQLNNKYYILLNLLIRKQLVFLQLFIMFAEHGCWSVVFTYIFCQKICFDVFLSAADKYV